MRGLMAKRRSKTTAKAPKTMPAGNGLPPVLLRRIEARLAALGMSKWALSARAGLGETYMADLFHGKNTKPSIQAMASIAKALECTVAYLIGESYSPKDGDVLAALPLMPLVGIVESGTFRKPANGEHTLVPRPVSKHHPEAKHFSLLVNDMAMAAATPALMPGMEALCIDIDDAGLPVEGGKIYAIRRTTDGKTYETILRRARVFRDRVELVAESGSFGTFESIIIKGELTTDRAKSVYAFGLVYGTFQSSE